MYALDRAKLPRAVPGGAGRHKCLIYDGEPARQLPVVIPFLSDSLESHWRCLYLGAPETLAMIDRALVAQGVDVAARIDRGALVLSSDRSYLEGGFDPAAMVALLGEMIDDAVQGGFRGLSAVGDLRWELGPDTSFDRLLEYEALLETLFREKPLQGICLYHSGRVPPQALLDALLAHRSIHLGTELRRDNFFYLPPETLLSPEFDRDRQCQWMADQITRVQTAERERDDALATLAASESERERLIGALGVAGLDLERRVAERTGELAAANEELQAFSYSVAHDLRAPLRHIDHYVSRMQDGPTAPLASDAAIWMQRILASTVQMNALISGLLGLAAATRQNLRGTPVDLSRMATAIAHQLQRNEPDRQVEFLIQPELTAFGDAVLLQSVLDNLIGNAWRFTGKRPAARIEFARMPQDDGEQVFRVSDNGAGFAPEAARRLFGLFERLHHQSEFPGTGLGLATVQRIVQRHGGRIWAEASPDEGATFCFSLPPLPVVVTSDLA